MARAIDADYLMERLNRKKAGPTNKRYTEGFNDCLMRVRSMVHSMPTLTPPNENEWVSVEERLPEEHPSMFARFFGTDRWSVGMFKVCSHAVIVTYKDETGNSRTTMGYTVDGAWRFTVGLITGEVTHWMPIPEPPGKEG